MNGRLAVTSMPSSSRNSRTSAACSLSPAATLPPGNSQRPARGLPAGRCAMSTCPVRSYSAAATTRMAGLAALLLFNARERTVTVLVLLARTARTRLVTSHLALAPHERAGTFGCQRRRRRRAGAGPRLGCARSGCPHAGSDRGLLLLGGCEERGGLGVLRLQRAHQAAAALLLLALDFLLGAHFDFRHQRGGLVLDPIEHGREQLEGFALELEAVVLLRVATQVNALPQVVHGGQVLAPVLIEHAQHDVLLDVAHDRRADARDLGVVGLVHGTHHALAQHWLLQLRLLGEPALRIHPHVEVAQYGLRQGLQVPVGRRGVLGHVQIQERAHRVLHEAANGARKILGAHDLGALLVYDLTLIVGDVIEQQQVLADVEVVRLDLALRLLDLAGEHAAFDHLAFLHAGHLQQPLGAQRIAEDAHQVVLHRQVEAARARVALAARATAQLIVDAAGFVALGADDVQAAGGDHPVVPYLPFRAYPLAGGIVNPPGRPACATMCASRSCCLAFSTSCSTLSFCRRPERNSEVSIEVVPTSTGCSRARHSRMSSMIALNLSLCVRYTKSGLSLRTIGRWVGITTTSRP